VEKSNAIDGEVRLYDRLFSDENPLGHEDKDFVEFLNPDSLQVISNAKLEPGMQNAAVGEKFQFLRMGYFCVDKDSTPGKPVFNRTVALKDGWVKK
jgi:glutaminyl-tRNA synthetase